MGVEMWLDATKYGRPQYAKLGFVTVNENQVVPPAHEDDAEYTRLRDRLHDMVIWQMWRPASGKYVEGEAKPWET